MGPRLLALGCSECGVQICGVCVEKCDRECPHCRSPKFRLPAKPDNLKNLWANRNRRDDKGDVAWVGVALGDLCAEADRTQEAVAYYTAAHELGSPIAAGRLYQFTPDPRKKTRLLMRHAIGPRDKVSAVAQFNLAVASRFEGNHGRAFRFFSYAARAGHSHAALELACGYEAKHGRGQREEMAKLSEKWLRVAANADIGAANYRLGIMAMKQGNVRKFYLEMNRAARLEYPKATSAMMAMLRTDIATGFCKPPEGPHCRVCMSTVNTRVCCSSCKVYYCSAHCHELDIVYGNQSERCAMTRTLFAYFLNRALLVYSPQGGFGLEAEQP